MDEIPAGNVCHMYYLCVSESCPLIRRSSHFEVVGVHTPFIKGQCGAQRLPTSMWGQHWGGLAAQDEHLSFKCPVDSPPSGTAHPTWVPEPPWPCCCCDATQAQLILSFYSQESRGDGPWELAMLRHGRELWILFTFKQSSSKANRRVLQHMLALPRTLICNSPKRKFQVWI